MAENNTQGTHKHRTPIPLDNPEIKKNSDWWDEMCRAHGAKNYWKKGEKKATKTTKAAKNKAKESRSV